MQQQPAADPTAGAGPPSASADHELLTLHGARVLGSAVPETISDLYGLVLDDVQEYLLDAEAYGWARRYGTGPTARWSLTERGRRENERRLADELAAASTPERDARAVVEQVHTDFGPLNEQLGRACTNWQIRPLPTDPLARNDHSDWRWDERVMDDLARIGRRLRPLTDTLTALLPRFGVHQPRYQAALDRIEQGDRGWIDGPDRPSCHIVWIQLHEDLLATLGIDRAG